MILFLKILIAHLIGDFVLQPDHWVKDKEAKKGRSSKLYLHIGVHVLTMTILTLDVKLLPIILIIGILHYLIDLCKLSLQHPQHSIMMFFIDQLAHFDSIVVVVHYSNHFLSDIDFSESVNQLLLLVLSLVLLSSVSSQVIKILISKWTPQTESKDEDSLHQAGKYIGILERVFIFAFVVTNNLQAIGFLLAAKSVFRFGDLRKSKDRKLTEYILIGTLLSFGIASSIAILYHKLEALL